MQRFFSILADAVTRFEGTVDKFTGDGIMAVFGAPIAHEDHARRACYAALQMLDDVSEYAAELRRGPGLNFSTRIGINSGEVVAGAIGDGAEGDYTAIGHTVGLAQRMEALAEPGKAYLTEHAAALAARLPRPRGPRRVRDQGREPAGAGLRAGRRRRGALAPRPRPRAGLLALRRPRPRRWRRWRRRWSGREAGEGRAVGLVAEPGRRQEPPLPRVRPALPRATGSRSSRRRHRRTGRRSRSCRCCRCCAPSSGSARATPSSWRARRSPAGRCCSTPSFADDLPLMFDFLGVPDPDRPAPQMSAEARQRALGGIVCRLVNAPTRRKTLVLVIEDLHWIDEGSDAMLAGLIDSIEGTNTLARRQLPPRIRGRLGRLAAVPRRSRWRRWRAPTPRELLRDLAGDRPLARRARRADPRAHPGQPLLHRGDRARAGRVRPPRGRARRLPAGATDRGRAACRSRVQAILAARIDRLDPGVQAAAAGGLGDRQGGQRPGAGADRRARAEEIDRAALPS